MSLTNPNTPVSQQDLQDFYHKLVPYMGGSSGGGGHTIEDAEGTDLPQRDTLQFGEGFATEDDTVNEKTVVTPDLMPSEDMSEVVSPLPSKPAKYPKYSTTEQIVAEWIDGKPIYKKTVQITMPINDESSIATGVTNGNHARIVEGFIEVPNGYTFPIFFANGSPLSVSVLVQTLVDGSYLYVWSNNENTNGKTAYITLQYTKTTD